MVSVCALAPGIDTAPQIAVALATDSDAREWDAYVEASVGSCLYHKYLWRAVFKSAFGKSSVYLIARAADTCVGVLPLVHMKSPLFGNFMVSLPYVNYGGVLADTPEVAQALHAGAEAAALERGCAHIEYRHLSADVLPLAAKSSKVTMLLPLPDSAEALWDGFKPKLRAQIRRPQKAGAKSVVGGRELLPDFYRVFAENMRDLGTPVYSRRFFAEIFERVEAARVCVVEMDNVPVAAGIVLGYQSTIEIPWASSLRSHNKHSPNMLLYWSLLEWATAEGFQCFDFGRCTPDTGTHRFKKQWGAQAKPMHWHYWLRNGSALPELNPDNPTYARLVQIWQKLPLGLTNTVGPHIVKHLP